MKRVAATALVILAMVFAPLQVTAESISISVTGNGSESVNTAAVSETSNTSVEQSNQTEVVNQIEESHNTGNNQVNGNTAANVNVETGEVSSTTQVVNQNINTNVVDTTCNECVPAGSTTIKVAGNGSESVNTVESNNTTSTAISQSNSATIVTSITQTANTGGNSVSSNTGSEVKLKTGDITATQTVVNSGINLSTVKLNQQPETLQVTIIENGNGSVNSISISRHNPTVYKSHNQANVVNILATNFDTGNNIMDGNTAGKVWLSTGSIKSHVLIANVDINSNSFELGCNGCIDPTDPEEPEEPCDPGDPGDPCDPGDGGGDNGGNGNGGNGNGGNGSSGSSSSDAGSAVGGRGQILGAMLPETGGLSGTLIALNAASFLAGLWLKLRQKLSLLLASKYTVQLTITW